MSNDRASPSTARTKEDVMAQLQVEARERNFSLDEYIRDIIDRRYDPERLKRKLADNRAELADRDARIDELESELERVKANDSTGAAESEDVTILRERLADREEGIETLQRETTTQIRQRQRLEEEQSRLRERLESREQRIDQLEDQLVKRSQIEDKVEELSLVVREDANASNAPFLVRWWKWMRK